MADRLEKWTTEQVTLLIDAYQEEPCLYATNTPNYHNKHLRAAALQRVSDAVSRLRHTVTPKDCSTKFHNLRNQFNIEHAKVKTSFKSGTGTDNIYTPSLWYYDKLLFLDTYVTPRKSRDSATKVIPSDSLSQVSVDAMDESSDDFFENLEYLHEVQEEFLPRSSPVPPINVGETSAVHVPLTNSSSSSSMTNRHEDFVFERPNMVSPAPSSSSSGVSSGTRKRKRARSDSHSEEYTRAIESIAKSVSEPININMGNATNPSMDPDQSFAIFLTSLLRQFKNFDLKMEVMQNVIQMVTNAAVIDRKRSNN